MGGERRGDDRRRPPPPSREELYRSVEDLRVHGYGPRLYADVASMMDVAASNAVRRLASSSGAGTGAGAGAHDGDAGGVEVEVEGGIVIRAHVDDDTGLVGYDASRLICDLGLLGNSS